MTVIIDVIITNKHKYTNENIVKPLSHLAEFSPDSLR